MVDLVLMGFIWVWLYFPWACSIFRLKNHCYRPRAAPLLVSANKPSWALPTSSEEHYTAKVTTLLFFFPTMYHWYSEKSMVLWVIQFEQIDPLRDKTFPIQVFAIYKYSEHRTLFKENKCQITWNSCWYNSIIHMWLIVSDKPSTPTTSH